MPITVIDAMTALVVVDLQKGIVGLPLAHPATAVVTRAGDLARAFHEHGLPVVWVTVNGSAPGRVERSRANAPRAPGWNELMPELPAAPDDMFVVKRTWGAFTHTDLEASLRARGVTQVVLAGIATSIGVESTARQAYEAGFHVTLAIDAMTDLSREAHEQSVTAIFPRLGETGTTAEVCAHLAARRR